MQFDDIQRSYVRKVEDALQMMPKTKAETENLVTITNARKLLNFGA